MKEKVRIAIYSRKSKYSDKGDSVGNQIEIAMKYIKEHFPLDKYDVEIVIFEDDGFSGGNIDRPKFKEFLIEENKKPFNILICYRLDRISRNIADFSSLMNNITELGTSFVSIKEQFDTKTPMGRAMMYIASVFAQLEREVITERIRDNMIELAKTGRWLGGLTPTGYTSKRIELVDVYEESDSNIIENTTGVEWPEEKYYDAYIYNELWYNYTNRILGDATGEMGPFQNTAYGLQTRQIGSWYADEGWALNAGSPWFHRGGDYPSGIEAGVFGFGGNGGSVAGNVSFRVILAI